MCAKFGIDRVNGRRDIAGRKVSKNVFEKDGPGGGAKEVHVRNSGCGHKKYFNYVCTKKLFPSIIIIPDHHVLEGNKSWHCIFKEMTGLFFMSRICPI